jgi:hypothetical protein
MKTHAIKPTVKSITSHPAVRNLEKTPEGLWEIWLKPEYKTDRGTGQGIGYEPNLRGVVLFLSDVELARA